MMSTLHVAKMLPNENIITISTHKCSIFHRWELHFFALCADSHAKLPLVWNTNVFNCRVLVMIYKRILRVQL